MPTGNRERARRSRLGSLSVGRDAAPFSSVSSRQEEDVGDVDETGVEPKDIDLVMTQARPHEAPST